MHVDPFEEIEIAEKSAEEHRRSATEEEVSTHIYHLVDVIVHNSLVFTLLW